MKEAPMAGLSFVTPLAYDWKYAFGAIRSYYAIADEIILGVDAERISWSKKPFSFDDQAVSHFVAEIDTDKKIRIIQDNFHTLDAPMANETAERKQLGAACRAGNWVVQIDSDEILLNPLVFQKFISSVNPDASVMASWAPVYKIFGNKALVVGGFQEAVRVATHSPHLYRFARVTDQTPVLSPLLLLHLAWCRTEEELLQKLTNWGHSTEIDIEKTVGLWRATTLENYQQLRNFHPLYGPLWQFLQVVDWPPKLFDVPLLDPQAAGGTMPETRDSRVIERDGIASSGVAISFGVPSTDAKGNAT
jgi:hypothetical protein